MPRWLSLLGTAVPSLVSLSRWAKGAWQARCQVWGTPCAGAVPGCGVPLSWGPLPGTSIPFPEALPPPVSLALLPGDSLCQSGGMGWCFCGHNGAERGSLPVPGDPADGVPLLASPRGGGDRLRR